MTYAAEHCIAGPFQPPVRWRKAASVKTRPRCRDERWPAVAAALSTLREARRSSVRIVDADCGAGTLLLCAVRYARMLGFTAIEARGIDAVAALVRRASASAAVVQDAAMGITFETGNLAAALEEESDFPADIVIWHGCAQPSAEDVRAVTCAGHRVIADQDAIP